MFDDNRTQMRKHLAQIVCVVWRYRHRVLLLIEISICECRRRPNCFSIECAHATVLIEKQCLERPAQQMHADFFSIELEILRRQVEAFFVGPSVKGERDQMRNVLFTRSSRFGRTQFTAPRRTGL